MYIFRSVCLNSLLALVNFKIIEMANQIKESGLYRLQKQHLKKWVTLEFGDQVSLLCSFNKLQICSILIVSKVVIKFRYGDLNYGHA